MGCLFYYNHPMNIRRLEQTDRDEWLRMRALLWPPDNPVHNPDVAEINKMLSDRERFPVWVAERTEGGLCGFLEVEIRSHAEGCTTDRIGYLEGWYVDADMREKGVGAALVAAGEAWAGAQGCTEMASDTTDFYPASQPAHAALGYEDVGRVIHFRKDL
jgi:aminoglycoside 6'-N-acetyltransferase I